MQTLKIKIKIDQNTKKVILKYQKQYSNLLHYCFNFFNKINNLQTISKYITNDSQLINNIDQLNNLDLINSWFKQSCIKQAYQLKKTNIYQIEQYNNRIQLLNQLFKKQNKTRKDIKKIRKLQKLKYPKVIFGGYKNFNQRCKNQMSKQEFRLNRLNPLYSIGTAKPYKGNRFFRITNDCNSVIFQPNNKNKYQINLIGIHKGVNNILKKLYLAQEDKTVAITYKLDYQYIYISFQQQKLYGSKLEYKKVKDRYLSLDLNPNYIGYTIIDWFNEDKFNIIKSGVYSFKQLNDQFKKYKGLPSTNKNKKYLNNKRKYEVIQVSKNLINLCKYYKVQNIIYEDLNIKKQDLNKGKNYNRLINNQWIKKDFINNLIKRCKIFNINYLAVQPQYSSFVGNILFRKYKLPDMCLSSIEISRRGYQFRHQYILKDKSIKKNIIKIDINDNEVYRELYIKSLEEFNIKENSINNIIDLYYYFKRNPKVTYRVSLDTIVPKSFREFLTNQSRLYVYDF